MRFRIFSIVITLTAFAAVIQADDDDGGSAVVDKYTKQMLALRKEGKSWKEIEAIMGIWSSEDEEQKFPEHIEPKRSQAGGRQAGTTKNPYDYDPETSPYIAQALLDQMYLVEAEGRLKFIEISQVQKPQNMKYTLPIIKYVAELDDDAILNVKDDD